MRKLCAEEVTKEKDSNNHLWRSELCPRTENTLRWGRRRKRMSQWAVRRAKRDSNILFYNPWVFCFCVASCNNNAIFVWFSSICLESFLQSLTGFVLSKACGLYDNRQWRSLCWNLFLVELKSFSRSGNDRACGGFCDRIYF